MGTFAIKRDRHYVKNDHPRFRKSRTTSVDWEHLYFQYWRRSYNFGHGGIFANVPVKGKNSYVDDSNADDLQWRKLQRR